MIFNCPDCNAGHSVPVSMIPNGGLDMDCRRCGEAFTVEPPVANGEERPLETENADLEESDDTTEGTLQAEKTNVGPPPIPEATRVGVANPLEEDSGTRPLIGPGGVTYDPDENISAIGADDTEANAPYVDRPTIPISTGHVPLGPDEEGVDPELDDTIRFGIEDKPVPSPAVTEPRDGEPFADPSEVHPPPRIESPMSRDPSVYERVAAGVAVPKDQEPRWGSQPSRVELKPGVGSMLRPAADLLNRAPLALKVGLIVFPLTLGVMLVITASSESESPAKGGPIEIPVGSPREAAAGVAAAPPPAEPAKPAKEEREDLREGDAPRPDDPPAPAGFSYVQVDNARLRVRASQRSAAPARLEIGSLVKVYEELDGWVLVAKQPAGPAGFISRKLLGERRPVAQLAREQPFERCSPGDGYTVDDCLYQSKQQEQTCLERCGAVNASDEPERLRCAQVCSIAFDACARSCRDAPKKRRRRRRR